jgi:hypothetical protein
MPHKKEDADAVRMSDRRRGAAALSPAAPGKKAEKESREARLSEALRANLRRRKEARKEKE